MNTRYSKAKFASLLAIAAWLVAIPSCASINWRIAKATDANLALARACDTAPAMIPHLEMYLHGIRQLNLTSRLEAGLVPGVAKEVAVQQQAVTWILEGCRKLEATSPNLSRSQAMQDRIRKSVNRLPDLSTKVALSRTFCEHLISVSLTVVAIFFLVWESYSIEADARRYQMT